MMTTKRHGNWLCEFSEWRCVSLPQLCNLTMATACTRNATCKCADCLSFSGLSLMGIGTSTADAPQDDAPEVEQAAPVAAPARAAPAAKAPLKKATPAAAPAPAPAPSEADDDAVPVSTFRSSSPPLRGAKPAPAMMSEFPPEEAGGEEAGGSREFITAIFGSHPAAAFVLSWP